MNDTIQGPIEGKFYDGDIVIFGGNMMMVTRRGKKVCLQYFALMGKGHLLPGSWDDVVLHKRHVDAFIESYGELPPNYLPANYYSIHN